MRSTGAGLGGRESWAYNLCRRSDARSESFVLSDIPGVKSNLRLAGLSQAARSHWRGQRAFHLQCVLRCIMRGLQRRESAADLFRRRRRFL
eukprot:352287-Rhodomonas_salina.3